MLQSTKTLLIAIVAIIVAIVSIVLIFTAQEITAMLVIKHIAITVVAGIVSAVMFITSGEYRRMGR